MKILIVCSTGGHLAQLVALSRWWRLHERTWVTFEMPSAIHALDGENIIWAHHPTTRHLGNALRNLLLAARVIRRYRPDLVVSTGAGVAAPFFLMARLWRVRTIYLEVIDRIASRTLTGRLVYPLSDAFVVQWPPQQDLYPNAHLIGPTL